jgi:hypothetical protein
MESIRFPFSGELDICRIFTLMEDHHAMMEREKEHSGIRDTKSSVVFFILDYRDRHSRSADLHLCGELQICPQALKHSSEQT